MNIFKKSVALIMIASILAGCIPPGMEKPSTQAGKPSAAWSKGYDPYADVKAEKKARDARKNEFYTSNKLLKLPPTTEQSKALSDWEAAKAKYAKVKILNVKQSAELGAAMAPLLLAADKEWMSLNPSSKEVEIVGRLASRSVDVDPAILPLYESVVKYRALHPQDESAAGIQESDLNKKIKEIVLAIRMGPYDETKIKQLVTNGAYGKILNDAHPNGYKVFHDYLTKSYTAGAAEYARAQQMKPSKYDALNVEGDIIRDFGLSYCDEKLNSKDRNHFSEGGVMMAAAQDAARFIADKTIAGTSPSSASAEMAGLLLKGRLASPVAQGLVASVPGVGVAIAAYELYTGKNAFTGQPLSSSEKVLSLASMVPGVGALGRNAGVAFLKSGLLQRAFDSAQRSGKYVDVADIAFSDAVDKIAGEYSPKKYADSKIDALFEREARSVGSAGL